MADGHRVHTDLAVAPVALADLVDIDLDALEASSLAAIPDLVESAFT